MKETSWKVGKRASKVSKKRIILCQESLQSIKWAFGHLLSATSGRVTHEDSNNHPSPCLPQCKGTFYRTSDVAMHNHVWNSVNWRLMPRSMKTRQSSVRSREHRQSNSMSACSLTAITPPRSSWLSRIPDNKETWFLPLIWNLCSAHDSGACLQTQTKSVSHEKRCEATQIKFWWVEFEFSAQRLRIFIQTDNEHNLSLLKNSSLNSRGFIPLTK